MFWLLYLLGANPCYELILKHIWKKLCCWWRLICCVWSCVDCNESLGLMNTLILLDCHYLKKDYPPCSYYIISEMLICFIFCSKLIQIERFFLSIMPKCLSDIMFYGSRGTWSRYTVPVCMLWHYKFVYVYHGGHGRKWCETKYKPGTASEYYIWEVSQFVNSNKHTFQQNTG